MRNPSVSRILNDNAILTELSNRLYRLNSINKILVSARDIMFRLQRPLSNINLISASSWSRVFAAGADTCFIKSLAKTAERTGVSFLLSDIFNLSIEHSKIMRSIIKEKESIIIGGRAPAEKNMHIYTPWELFEDFILCNRNIKAMADRIGRKKLWKMIDLEYALVVPFYSRSATYGYFMIAGGKKDPRLEPYDINLYLSIRNIVSNAIVNYEYKRLLLQQNRNLESKNRELARKNEEIERIEQLERENLSEILHDTISQMVAASGLSLGILKKDLQKNDRRVIKKKDTGGVIKRLDHLIAANKNILTNIKHIYKMYSPERIKQKGLFTSLLETIEEYENLFNLRIRCEFPEPQPAVNAFISSIVFKIIQESFYNILKHSGAKKVILKIHSRNNFLFVFLRDFGSGFDISKIQNTESKGIQGMVKKSILLKGRLNIYSSLDKGTIVYFKVPL
ncbi:MAG: hypothetical protein A2096_02660 [Spirochaetes bacterium GWF1_41_5]|nr:MAG: hypothetical protein A2096_02660 [Spirochaetes bacterium GWF1_41_5]HBE01559.1 hypothetical protein [Spirochaetia bacterium]